MALVDLGAAKVQFYSFACSFQENWPNNRLAYAPFEVGAPIQEFLDPPLHD